MNETFDMTGCSPKAEIEKALEKALVGFPDGGDGWIIFSTPGIQGECASTFNWSANDLESSDGVTPDHGFWVWEGVIEVVQTGNWEHPDEWGLDYQGVFREPTADEWAAIMRQENPWGIP